MKSTEKFEKIKALCILRNYTLIDYTKQGTDLVICINSGFIDGYSFNEIRILLEDVFCPHHWSIKVAEETGNIMVLVYDFKI
jgi:hypothetical protein